MGSTSIWDAAADGISEEVEWFLQSGENPNACGDDQQTALHKAARFGHLSCVQVLLKSNADTCTLDGEGNTPLHLAVFNQHLDCTKIIAVAGGLEALQHKDAKGNTPYDVATSIEGATGKAAVSLREIFEKLYLMNSLTVTGSSGSLDKKSTDTTKSDTTKIILTSSKDRLNSSIDSITEETSHGLSSEQSIESPIGVESTISMLGKPIIENFVLVISKDHPIAVVETYNFDLLRDIRKRMEEYKLGIPFEYLFMFRNITSLTKQQENRFYAKDCFSKFNSYDALFILPEEERNNGVWTDT